MAQSKTSEDAAGQGSADAPAEEGTNAEVGNGKPNFRTVLKSAGFRNLWLGQVISQVGDYFAFLATLVVVSAFSDDPQTVTLSISGMLIAEALPRLLFGMVAGVFVDRWDRRRTMIVSDVLRAGITLAMIPAFLSRNLALMYALGFALSTVGTLFNPAKMALIPKLVRTEDLTAANALTQTSQMLATLIGPALAGAVFTLAGRGNEWVAFVTNSVSFVVSAFAIWLIRLPAEQKSEIRSQKSEDTDIGAVSKVWQELVVGLRALFLNRTMVTLAITFAVTMLGAGAINALWVTNLKVHFGFTSTEMGWRISVGDIGFSLGMIVASVVIGNYLAHVAPKWLIVAGLTVAGLLTLPLGYLPDYWLLVADLLIIGAFIAPINTGGIALMQAVVPNEQMGRVSGGINTVIETATLTSMGLAGVFGAVIGIPFVFLLSGVLVAGAGLMGWALLPAITLKNQAAGTQPAPPHAASPLAPDEIIHIESEDADLAGVR